MLNKPGTRLWRKRNVLLFAFCIGSLAVLAFVPAVRCLSLSVGSRPSDRVLFRFLKDTFYISYTHSVNKGRIYDYYRCVGKELVLERTCFVSYGAGMPELADTAGAEFISTDTCYSLTGLNRRFVALHLVIGETAAHGIGNAAGNLEFSHDGLFPPGEIRLDSLFSPQTGIVIAVKKVSVLDYLTAYCLQCVSKQSAL
ncbi:MAG: DUF1850 domain-containing protein [Treponema sp.]|nr:DUF1850 domain-containing protein [Treponema sp.]